MAADIPRVYRDSCIFIHALKKTPEHYSKIISIENEARDGRLNIYVSSLVIAEVAWFEKRKDITEEQYHLIARYFQHKFMRVVPVDRPVAKIAAEIVRNHELRPADSIHIATSIRTKCEVFYTYDGDGNEPGLLQKSGMIGAPAMPIKRPGDWGQLLMDTLGPSEK